MSLHVVGAAILEEGRCLVTQRSATMAHPLKWEFPGGKVEPDERPRDALVREIREELGLHIEVHALLATGHAHLPDGRPIRLDVFYASRVGGTLELTEHARAAWCDAKTLARLDWPEADIPAMRALIAALS